MTETIPIIGSYVSQTRSAIGLAIFRIAWSATLLLEVGQLFIDRHLFFDVVAYEVEPDFDLGPALIAWMIALCFLLAGFHTRVAAAFNYALTIVTFSTFHLFEYHVDYIYTGINLLLLFTPTERALSVDAIRNTSRQSNICSAKVPRLFYDALIVAGIGLVYLDSVGYKLSSPMWTSGLGFYRPASLPHNCWVDLSVFLDSYWLVATMGYCTIAFEALFLVAMWWRKCYMPLLLIGGLLHLGILVAFPLPCFAAALLSLYLVLVPDRWWQRMFARTDEIPLQSLYSGPIRYGDTNDGSRMTSGNQGAISATNDRSAMSIVATLVALMCAAQLIQAVRSPMARRMAQAFGADASWHRANAIAVDLHGPSRTLLGATPHGVFMDGHFDDYDCVYRVICDVPYPEPLGVYRDSGLVSPKWSGRKWVFWTFRTNAPDFDSRQFIESLERVIANWCGHRGLDHAQFKIVRREYDPFIGHEPGYLARQMKKAWTQCGSVAWQDGKCSIQIDETDRKSHN